MNAGAICVQCGSSFLRLLNLEIPIDTPRGVSLVIWDSVKLISTLTITPPHTTDFRAPECIAGSKEERGVPSIQATVLHVGGV